MDKGLELLSSLTIFSKYGKYSPEVQRRETWDEIVDRYELMMMNKYPALKKQILQNSVFIREKKVLPSMRAMQFAGPALEVNNARGYNCFSRDTRFITSLGVKSFRDFEAGTEISVLTHTGSFKKAVVKSYGKQRLTEITLKRGKSVKTVKATANHRWILKDGSETVSLKIGDMLYKAPDFISEFIWEEATPWEQLAWCYGYVYGDGTVTKKNEKPIRSMVRLCGDQVKFLDRFTQMGFESSSSMSLKGDIIVYTGKYLKTLPKVTADSFNELRGFIIGYLDADGYKNNNQSSKQIYSGIQATGKEAISFIEEAFEIVSMYINSYDDLTGQETNYGIRPYTKRFRMNHIIGGAPNNHWSIGNIKEAEEAEVWCLEVEEDHSFVLSGGVVTGNCAYLPIDSIYSFSEIMFLLLGGTGVGYSVQKRHIDQLPPVNKPTRSRRFLVSDDIMGWADAVKVLMKAYLGDGAMPEFDFRGIRAKGTRLITAGGKAPGPEPLKLCLIHIQAILDRKKDGQYLSSLEVHDICCHIANSVLAGGIRRSAMISLFSADDMDMLTCKYGNWWELNEQRGRANNSVVLLRGSVSEAEFADLWHRIQLSGSGEPGIYWTNDLDWGTNPCCEIALRPYQMCNLCEINVDNIESQDDLNSRAWVAAFFGTLQAGFTDFHYLRPIWKRTCEKDALLGIGQTGIGSGEILKYNLEEAVQECLAANSTYAPMIGINKAARVTCIKPSGTTSCVLGCSSGIHAWHDKYYLRTMRFNKNEEIAVYLQQWHPEICEDDVLRAHDTLCVRIPVKAPEQAILRTEAALDTLERVKHFAQKWIGPGHVNGANTHNVSATISISKDKLFVKTEGAEYIPLDFAEGSLQVVDEWEVVGEWMWKNREYYNGISVLPFDGGSYSQAPFESISKEEYEIRAETLREVSFSSITEQDDNVQFSLVAACAGGACSTE